MKFFSDYEPISTHKNFYWKDEDRYLVYIAGVNVNISKTNEISLEPVYKCIFHLTRILGFPAIETPWLIAIFSYLPPFIIVQKPDSEKVER